MTTIREETVKDYEAIREVHGLAFNGDDEAKLVDNLRKAGHVKVSFVVVKEGWVVGHILFSDLPIETERGIVHAVALAPMAVVPKFQKMGIGSALVRKGLDACRKIGQRIVIVLGHPWFYPRFGFSPELTQTLKSAYSGPAFMALELCPGALNGIAGTIKYPTEFKGV